MQKLNIDQDLFIHAYCRDADFEDKYPQSTYLDLKTGDIRWVYDDDADAEWDAGIPATENGALREQIDGAPDQYLRLPGFSHGGHHAILQEFFDSDWTKDEDERRRTRAAYFGSIGGWIEAMHNTESSDAVDCYYIFRDLRMRQLAKEFLHKNNIDPGWD